jgi:hypothetical protein
MLHGREVEIEISNCLCKCYIEESQGYQIVCENGTSKRGRDIKLRMLHIEDRQGYQIVHVNVASKKGRDIKLFVRMLHRREAGISN